MSDMDVSVDQGSAFVCPYNNDPTVVHGMGSMFRGTALMYIRSQLFVESL